MAALAAVAFWPTPVDRGAEPLLQFITQHMPLLTYPRIEFAGNVLLFVPLGLLLTLSLARRPWLALPISIVVTVTIESVQAIALEARTPSVLDVIANTTGACVGILLALLFQPRRAPSAATHAGAVDRD